MEYNIKQNLSNMHNNFNNECEDISSDFKNNKLMKSIVQNCDYDHGIIHLNYIKENFPDIYDKIDFYFLKVYDLVGGQGVERLINGVSPKVISYIREALFFYNTYFKSRGLKEIKKIMIIGGGYGMEAAVLYYIFSLCGLNIKNIIGIDMENVAKLQNSFFKEIQLDDICSSYGPDYKSVEKLDCVYSNCCLAELSPEINWDYYQKYVLNSAGFFAVWGAWAADVPSYYNEYICKDEDVQKVLNEGLNINTNILLTYILV